MAGIASRRHWVEKGESAIGMDRLLFVGMTYNRFCFTGAQSLFYTISVGKKPERGTFVPWIEMLDDHQGFNVLVGHVPAKAFQRPQPHRRKSLAGASMVNLYTAGS